MNDDKLSVATSPQSPGHGVRRLNRIPLLMVFTVLLIVLAVLSWAVYQRAQARQLAAQEQTVIQQQDMGHIVDKLMAGYQDGGLIEPSLPEKPPEPEPEKPEVKEIPVAIAPKPAAPIPAPRIEPPVVKQTEPPQLSPEEQAALQRYEQIRQQLFNNALQALVAPTVVNGSFQSGESGAGFKLSTAPEPLSELQQARLNVQRFGNRAATLRRQQQATPITGRQHSTSAEQSLLAMLGNNALNQTGGNSIIQSHPAMPIENSVQGEFTYSRQQRQRPRSQTELRVGTLIPAVMISGINSDLPGEVLAQVTEAVRDSHSGQYVLIPQGAKLVGRYVSDIAEGQERVWVAWYRVNFPDGSFLNLDAMNGVDQAGYSGFHDKVNKHTLDKFKEATLLSLIAGGVQLSQTNSDETSRQLAAALGQQWGKVGEEVVKRKLERAPTLEIRPGYRFHVFINRGLVLGEYEK